LELDKAELIPPFLNHPAKKEGVYIQAALVGGWWYPVVVFDRTVSEQLFTFRTLPNNFSFILVHPYACEHESHMRIVYEGYYGYNEPR
jgi:hypothetical protein